MFTPTTRVCSFVLFCFNPFIASLYFVARGDICPGAGPAAEAPRCQALLSQQDRLLRGVELRPRAQPADRPAYKAGVTLPVRKQ